MLKLLFTSRYCARQFTYSTCQQWSACLYGSPTRSYNGTPTDEGELDQLEHMLTKEDKRETRKEYKRLNEADQAIRKRKTIERKHFRKPPEISLLTYAAKEQIRFLFNEYPNEWTIDRLAASFPVSREGVIKIIKSKSVRKSEEQILQHDLRVKENWKTLKDGRSDMGGPITVKYQELISSGKMNLLQYCMGNSSLPKPLQNSVTKVTALEARKQRPPGVFESIIKDYCKEKDAKKQSDKIQSIMSSQLLDNDEELKSVLKSLIPPNSKVQITSGVSNKMIEAKYENIVDQIERDTSLSTNKHDIKQSNIVITQSFDNMLDDTGMSKKEKKVKKYHRGLLSSQRNLMSLEQMQLQGTGKIGSDKSKEEIQNLQRENKILGPQKMSKFAPDNLSEQVRNSVQIDQSPSGTKTPYMYSSQDGYQYPYGMESTDEEFIEIPENKQEPGKLYKKGDKYYDHTGELLYRVPEY
ncbi:unnamed protein product [Owenia fusiformis]|uniref:Uncharacterized protein n=1 Tax=Owenia fusiformis TaxID=6347 RepID=A0A8J1TWP0_OWEFU|nr:unnamed protein product [Owenia fusiformis]